MDDKICDVKEFDIADKGVDGSDDTIIDCLNCESILSGNAEKRDARCDKFDAKY